MSVDALILIAAVVLMAAVLGELVWRRVSGNRLSDEYVAAKRRAARTPSYLALAPTAIVAAAGARNHSGFLIVTGGVGFVVAFVAYLWRRRQIFSGVSARGASR